jgi:geranylgeranyl diphosphate synthase type II
MDAEAFLRAKGEKTDRVMAALVDSWADAPTGLLEAMRYSLLGGGKRLRPALALGAAELLTGDDAPAMPAACAIEMIHTYSLIHDDLPAMDDDDLRRGRPTLHKVYGEANAILAGDTLLTMAFDVAAEPGDARVVREIAQAAGVRGMAGGQYLDLASEGRPATLDELRRIHASKTGALIRAAVRCGALLAGAEDGALRALTDYAEHIGLAFQIADDILDVIGDEAALGKPVGSDEANAKATYPSMLGLEESRRLADEAMRNALDALAGFGPEADAYRALARYIVQRDH